MELKDIESMSAEKYLKLCKEKVQAKAFDFLQKKSHENVRQISYSRLEMAKYLKANDLELTVEERQFFLFFQCRTILKLKQTEHGGMRKYIVCLAKILQKSKQENIF